MAANKSLAVKQGVEPETLLKIDHLHELRHKIHYLLDSEILKPSENIGSVLFEIEAQLQEYWNFSVNMNLYKFWNVPTCVCPKMDNEDKWPHGYYAISRSCPLHGEYN